MHRSRRIAPGMPLHGPDRKSARPAKSRACVRTAPGGAGRTDAAAKGARCRTACRKRPRFRPRGEKLRLNSVLLRHQKAGIGSKSPQLQETPCAAHPPPPPPPDHAATDSKGRMRAAAAQAYFPARPESPASPLSPRRALKAGHPPRHALPASRRSGSARPGAGARGRCARLACRARRARDLLARGPGPGDCP